MIVVQGQGVSSGIAIAPIAFYQRQTVAEEKTSIGVDEEWQKFCAAAETAQAELERLTEKARAEAGEEASLLFETHQMMLDDEDYREAIETKTTRLCSRTN